MNLKIEFARKMALAYTAVCRPLCQEMKLPQTAFDILFCTIIRSIKRHAILWKSATSRRTWFR